MKKLLVIVCLFCPVWVFAQQGQTGLNGFSFVAPLQISGGEDHGFLVDRTDPNERLLVLSLPPSVQVGAPNIKPLRLDDNIMVLTLPKMAFQNDSKRHEFLATWSPEVELFQHNSDQNALNHQAVGTFTYFFARNLEVSAGDTYKSSRDPARTLENVFLLLPRSPYTENDIRANIEFQPNAVTSFGARYDNDHTNFGQTDPFQSHFLDSISQGYSFLATRMLSRTQRLRGTYSIFRIAPIDHHATGEDQVDASYAFERPIHSGILEYRVTPTPGTVLEFTGGVIKMDTGLNYTFTLSGDKRLGTFWWVGGGYSRALSFQAGSSTAFASGLASNGFFDVVTLRFKGQPTRRTAITFATTMSREVSSPLVNATEGLMARTRFDYRVSDREVLFASLENFYQNENAYVGTPLSRDRFTVGIQISLSSETDRRLNHYNEDSQYVALTDHQRRQSTPQQ
ncbi:MAG TPA: hypothetical protein VGK48_10970 [Terriglobia bacterium]|jgi:hypothetical protein